VIGKVEKYLRRVIRIGGSAAVVLPKTLVEKLSEYIWVEARGEEIVLRKARVE